jgi:hypothetical protein
MFWYNTFLRLALFLVVTSALDCKGFCSARLIPIWLLFMMMTSHSSVVLYVCQVTYQSCRNTLAFQIQMLETLEPDGLIGYLRSVAPEIQMTKYGIYRVTMRLWVFALT